MEKAATAVNQAALKNQFDNIIVVAPPRALGVLRKCIDKGAARKIHAEVRSEWTKLGRKDIETRVARYL